MMGRRPPPPTPAPAWWHAVLSIPRAVRLPHGAIDCSPAPAWRLPCPSAVLMGRAPDPSWAGQRLPGSSVHGHSTNSGHLEGSSGPQHATDDTRLPLALGPVVVFFGS